VAFLIVYGALRFRAAVQGGESLKAGASQPTLAKVLLAGAAFTWLNPHVYLDTLGIVGAVSTGYPEVADKIAFGIGAASASFVFFFSLGYGARLLAPLLKKPRAWQIIEIVIGATMWAIALGLILSA
jgi:L-lysine exporter family protein LysE/ArgO